MPLLDPVHVYLLFEGTEALLTWSAEHGMHGRSYYVCLCCAEVLDSMGLIKAAALRIDLSIGKAGSGFADLISGDFTPGEDAISYNFSLIDTLAAGLNAQRVCFNPVSSREMRVYTCQHYVTP